MSPDFKKATIDVLSKRAAFKCSNPDCRVSTVGPNSDNNKSTSIGEAAHIYGARETSKRYIPDQTNVLRSDITNAIWLCRNCHKLIDTDENRFSVSTLFAWREHHENYILSELGTATDKIHLEEQTALLLQFKDHSPLIRRIVLDQPDGWEWRLTAELMRYLNNPLFRKLDDLNQGLYIKAQTHLNDEHVLDWIFKRLNEASKMIEPFHGLLGKLTESFGPPGKSGSVEEIFHITNLIRDQIEYMLKFEEVIHFTIVSSKYENLLRLLKNMIGSQAKKLANIPKQLDEVVEISHQRIDEKLAKPLRIENIIEFSVPENWEENFDQEMRKVQGRPSKKAEKYSKIFAIIIFILFLVYVC
ncbi:MAG: hypothetical protein ABUK01_17995 [Leptospirales bacterium]